MSERFNENSWIRVILLYLIPIAAWISYTYQNSSLSFSFEVAAIGSTILFFGSALFISLLKPKDEPKIAPKIIEVPVPTEAIFPLAEWEEKVSSLEERLKLQALEFEGSNQDLEKIQIENRELREKLQEMTDSTLQHSEEAQHKIQSLELELHQSKQHSTQLENQIHDLRYEIKTLLNLTEVGYSHPEPSKKEEAALPEPFKEYVITPQPQASGGNTRALLTRCLDIAQKITAGYHTSSLRGLTLDPYAFDLRRLADALRYESSALILLYSPKEERLLFANGETKELFGVSPEEFLHDFSDYAGADFAKWKNAVVQLLTKVDVTVALEFKNRFHEPVPLNAHMATIPTGAFRSSVMVVLTPVHMHAI